MSRAKVAFVLAFMILGASASRGTAGGWWHYVDYPPTLAPGDNLEVPTGQLIFTPRSAEADRAREQQGYFAYLIEGLDEAMVDEAMSHEFDRNWWDLGTASAHLAGTVEIHDGASNLARGTIHLEVPEVDPGRYELMLCNLECRQPLANVVPLKVTIVDDQAVAMLSRQVDNFKSRLFLMNMSLREKVRRSVAERALEEDLVALEKEVASLNETSRAAETRLSRSLEDLSDRVADLERGSGAAGTPALGLVAVGGFLFGALALVSTRVSRTSKRRRPATALPK